MRYGAVRSMTCFVACILLAGSVGCSDKGKKPKKVRTITGIAKKIDLKSNYVSMSFVAPDGKERTLEGILKEDTDVIINGRAGKLEDVRIGDKVTVSGYREGKDEDLKCVATRVEVTRAGNEDWKPTASAAKTATTQPSKP